MHPEDRVLVAIMNKRHDFERLRDQGWYRIPVKRAPQSTLDSDYVAFYFTKAFGEERWAIHWYAPVRGHEMVRRRDLLPDEPDHPRADEAYYKLQLGPLERLEPPIISLRWRRITFIETTWDRFQMAQEINELYASGADGLFVTLKEMGLAPEREVPLREGGVEYVVDLVVPCREGTVAIALGERPAPETALRVGATGRPQDDVERVVEAVKRLGGVQLSSSATGQN
ncbi:MAG: hypothetical protein PVF45_14100 [Anaerolineae bacterium]|jgi:hypothetical protein